VAKQSTTLDMSDERFEEFLNRMATDDDLRDAMKRDPHATLTGAGFRVSKDRMLKKVSLPSKREIKAKLDEYMERKRGAARVHVPFGWVARDCDEEKEDRKPRRTPKPKVPVKAKTPKKTPRKPGK